MCMNVVSSSEYGYSVCSPPLKIMMRVKMTIFFMSTVNSWYDNLHTLTKWPNTNMVVCIVFYIKLEKVIMHCCRTEIIITSPNIIMIIMINRGWAYALRHAATWDWRFTELRAVLHTLIQNLPCRHAAADLRSVLAHPSYHSSFNSSHLP